MGTISVRFEDSFVKDIEKIMKKHRYSTKTEFIREAVRDKIKDIEKEEAIIRLEKIYGRSDREITDKQLEKAREKAFSEIAKRHGIRLD